ncbi:uncharacterized protein K452DRAFT_243704 [Aplosporella prunicola CBS 121167]|uniref:Uncharacterized protein n=1 Tax=Aplosporella prunicola CBS 121167 TaxID=1176127 RepID=A0A6A6BQP3_9PEZI|nr:uncharacterized protein K452DRAFT_243704 [Aplosporella prunicola CBS 121167]KAF2145564.1 hypothetical protein K452DRAFT_243704 [Aplosporella prunicola CBS 121167]
MPLVVPGLQSTGDKTQDWSNQLLGKKIGDTSDNVTFAKQDLPQSHRIVQEGGPMTMDYNPERLNVHVAEDGTVRKVTHG